MRILREERQGVSRNVFGATARVSSAIPARRVEARGLRVKRNKRKVEMRSVLNKSNARVLVINFSECTRWAVRTASAMPAQRGREGDQDERGKTQGEVRAAVFNRCRTKRILERTSCVVDAARMEMI